MARDEAPPFARGETYYNGSTKDSIFTDPLNLLGKEFVFEPNSPDSQDLGDQYGRPIRVKVVQNKSGQALKPKRIATCKLVAGAMETQVDGYNYGVGAGQVPAGVIDEFLPAAGVPDGDLFYLVIDGPTKVQLPDAGPTANIAIGDRLVTATGTSKTNDDGGRVDALGTAATDPNATLFALDVVGRSEAAHATTDTAASNGGVAVDCQVIVHFSGR